MNLSDVYISRLYVDLTQQLKNYIKENKLKSVVLGVSGGIDSALVASISRPVCDELGVKLIGLSLPSSTNKSDEVERADKVGNSFCHEYKTISIEPYIAPYRLYYFDKTAEDKKDKIRYGNIKARTRMIMIYDTAQLNDGCVLGTDNYTELMLGFWTLHGDVGDVGLIQNLWKTQVYKLSEFICEKLLDEGQKDSLDSCIKAVPTDGLGISSSDLEQIGASTYKEVDQILENYLKGDRSKTDHPVIKRHLTTHFKRNNPYNVVVARD